MAGFQNPSASIVGVAGYATPLTSFLSPVAGAYESFPRIGSTGQAVAGWASGLLFLQAIVIPQGVVVGHLGLISGGTAANTPTHWWCGLYDNNRNQLAVSADQLATALPALTLTSVAVAQVAAGPATSFTTTYTGIHYFGIAMVATAVNNFVSGGSLPIVAQLAPTLSGTSDGGIVGGPPAFPHQAAVPSSNGAWIYAFAAP